MTFVTYQVIEKSSACAEPNVFHDDDDADDVEKQRLDFEFDFDLDLSSLPGIKETVIDDDVTDEQVDNSGVRMRLKKRKCEPTRRRKQVRLYGVARGLRGCDPKPRNYFNSLYIVYTVEVTTLFEHCDMWKCVETSAESAGSYNGAQGFYSAMHGMPAWTIATRKLSVRPSVRPSVCLSKL